ncbi:conserved Plasmodium protein, unknown function [Plasmodium sp. DRC-Itaito]|nr:conserved Plasmodium protein, unknown function [Plasmodium sp. DRC-Itaito]
MMMLVLITIVVQIVIREIHKVRNEILKLYKFIKRKINNKLNDKKYEYLDFSEKSTEYNNKCFKVDNRNIIFLLYPPNCGVKRLVELTCYACDLCPIYENKEYQYINANRLDKNSMNELNTRNDICICLYEDKNYIINNFNNFTLPILDNINHLFIKFSYPSKKALFYRCFAVSSCVIKNLRKKTFKILFEICKLKNLSYSIESIYNKVHLNLPI